MNIHQNNTFGDNNVNFGPQQRTLDNENKKIILSFLKGSEKIEIATALGNAEAFTLAIEIKKFLSDEGFEVKDVSQVVWSAPIVGVQIDQNLINGFRRINVGSQ